jgi:hypothetical protein
MGVSRPRPEEGGTDAGAAQGAKGVRGEFVVTVN